MNNTIQQRSDGKLWAAIGAVLTICFVATLLMTSGMGWAQETASDQRTELGVRQKLVQRKMVELEAKFTIVAERIRAKDAKRADLLIKTYQQSKELSLTKKMDEVSDLLNAEKYDEADKELNEVVEILESLIRMLTSEKEKSVSAKEEIAMLEAFKKNVENQLQQQRKQTRATEQAANKEDAGEQIGAQIKALNKLIESQKQIVKETADSQNANLKQLDKIADRQFELRKQTDELKKNISGEQNNLNPDGTFKPQPQSDEPGVPRPGQGKAEQRKPKAGTRDQDSNGESSDDSKERQTVGEAPSEASDAKPSEGESSAGKPSEGQPSEGQPSDAKKKSAPPSPQDSEPRASKPGSSKPLPPPRPGEKALEKSAEHQQRAEEKLGSGKPADARRQQEQALEALEKALSELEKEKRRIESLPPEILEQLAKQQRRNRDKTMDIVQAMEKAPKPKSSEDKGGEGQQPKQPGQEQMEQAGNAQKKAADNMQQNDAESAQKEQKQAEQKMEKALEEIEDRLSQLREETNEEKLARLEARFREMLQRQNVASVMTIEIEDKRFNLGQIRLRDQLLILRLATEELEIRELGQQAYDLLLEDGTSIVFPEVVQDLRSDLELAAEMLQSERTDQYTQLIQKEIETTIEDLLDALKEVQQDGKKSGGGGGGGGKQPLLKKSAELKILRMRQRRLNRRTKKLEIIREQPALADVIEKEITDAAAMQKKILEMTDNILKKQ